MDTLFNRIMPRYAIPDVNRMANQLSKKAQFCYNWSRKDQELYQVSVSNESRVYPDLHKFRLRVIIVFETNDPLYSLFFVSEIEMITGKT